MKVSSIRWGVIWIGIGLFFMAINLEVMDALVFPRLFSLWPVLLIAIGVELIFRKTRLYFLALLSPILIAGAFIVAASYHTGWGWDFEEFFHGWSWSYKGEMISEAEIPFESEIDTLNIKLDCGNADFDIRPNADLIFSAKSSYLNRSPLISNHTDNRTIFVTYQYRDKSRLSFLNFGASSLQSDFKITDRIPVVITLDTKVGRPRIDLEKVRLARLSLSLKSKETKVRFGGLEDSLEIRIEGKTERLEITAPMGMGLEIAGDVKKLKRAVADAGFVEFGGGFRSNGYSDALQIARIVIDARISSISVDRD